MRSHALIRLTNPPVFVEYKDAPGVTREGWAIVPVVIGADAPHDPATQKLVRALTVASDKVTEHRIAVSLTAEELAAAARETSLSADREQARTIYARLVAGTATNAQVQRVLAWLLKREGLDL